jgi:hypothetical protein
MLVILPCVGVFFLLWVLLLGAAVAAWYHVSVA